MSDMLVLGIAAGVICLLGKTFKPALATAIFILLFNGLPLMMLPPYGTSLLGTLPLSIVFGPVLFFVYRYFKRPPPESESV